jgi:uncharacterized protein (TIGR03435 family)
MRDRFGVVVLVGMLSVSGAAFGQGNPASQPAAAKLSFDVASVRPSPPMDQATLMASLRAGKRPESLLIQGSRATFTYMSLKELIAYGYKVRTYQITGPQWIVTDRFEIAAKLPDGATRDDVPAMMKELLADRFKLAAHLETKEHPVLGLMVGKGGSKVGPSTVPPPPIDESTPLKPGESRIDSSDGPIHLKKNADGSTTYNMGPRGSFTLKIDGDTGTMHLTASGMTMRGFAFMLTTLGGDGRPVVDMTGLAGNYELAVDFSLQDLVASLRDQGLDIPVRPDAGPSDPNGDSTVADALAKLGLKLERSKAMVEQLVIDHVEKAATEN